MDKRLSTLEQGLNVAPLEKPKPTGAAHPGLAVLNDKCAKCHTVGVAPPEKFKDAAKYAFLDGNGELRKDVNQIELRDAIDLSIYDDSMPKGGPALSEEERGNVKEFFYQRARPEKKPSKQPPKPTEPKPADKDKLPVKDK
jgi:mono/diheme cytochrome c family protein